jgi:hypothetical protein
MGGFVTGHIKECCACGAGVDTREECDGGNPDGAEIDGGDWVCSPECWDDIMERIDSAIMLSKAEGRDQ